MGIFRNFPYSNFHEMNLDEIIKIMRELQEEWNETKTEWNSMKEFIENYFENLDVSEEISNKINSMIASGQFLNIIEPDIISTTQQWLNDHISITEGSTVIDESLTINGAAADAAVTGAWVYTNRDFILTSMPISENFIDVGLCQYNLTWGETVGVSTTKDLTTEANTTICRRLIKVKGGDVIYLGCDYVSEYNSNALFGLFCWDGDQKFIKRINSQHRVEIDFNGYVSVIMFACQYPQQILDRHYYCNLNKYTGWTGNNLIEKYNSDNEGYTRPSTFNLRDGFYDENGTFYESTDYQTALIPVTEGEKYKVSCYIPGATQWPCARFFNSGMKQIGSTEAVSSNTLFSNYEVTIPYGCNYMAVSNMPFDASNWSRFKLQIVKCNNGLKSKPLGGKSVLIFGDSITRIPYRWRDYFLDKSGASQLMCLAYVGAHLCDYPDTILDGNYDAGGSSNTICNQVYWCINNMSILSGNQPDIIIISAFTNDYATVESLAPSTDLDVYDTSSGWIDVNTVDRTTPDGAMRWIHTKLKEAFPNAIIAFASPIQSAPDIDSYHTSAIMVAKEEKMERICKRLSDVLIKATTESGITGEFEQLNTNGRYLADGLHPNLHGGERLGHYYAHALAKYFAGE